MTYVDHQTIAAALYLRDALSRGPVAVSVLRFGFAIAAYPDIAIDEARGILGVVESIDEYGVAMWEIGNRRKDNEGKERKSL